MDLPSALGALADAGLSEDALCIYGGEGRPSSRPGHAATVGTSAPATPRRYGFSISGVRSVVRAEVCLPGRGPG